MSLPHTEVDGAGRVSSTKVKMGDAVRSDMNPAKAACGPIPSAVRMPDARLSVCVIGGDGPLGRVLVRGLSNPNYAAAFEIFVVDGAVASAVTADNCARVLTPRLQGMHTVIMADYRPMNEVTAANLDEVERVVMGACKDAGVKRFLPSPFGFDTRTAGKLGRVVASIQRAVERQTALSTCGMDYTVISCGVLTEHLFSPMAGVDLQRGTLHAPGGLNTQVTTTSLDDLSRLLPEVLLSPSSRNKHVDLASATLTYKDIARIIEQVTGRSVAVTEVSSSDVRRRAEDEAADPAAVLNFLIESGKGLLWSKGDSWNAQHVPHVHTTSVEAWAREHLTANGGQHGVSAIEWEPNLHPAALSAPPGAAITRPDVVGSTITGEQVEMPVIPPRPASAVVLVPAHPYTVVPPV